VTKGKAGTPSHEPMVRERLSPVGTEEGEIEAAGSRRQSPARA